MIDVNLFSKYKTNKFNIQERNDIYWEKQVSPSLTIYNNTPHFLMELSEDEYKILKPNSIHIGGVSQNVPHLRNEI